MIEPRMTGLAVSTVTSPYREVRAVAAVPVTAQRLSVGVAGKDLTKDSVDLVFDALNASRRPTTRFSCTSNGTRSFTFGLLR